MQICTRTFSFKNPLRIGNNIHNGLPATHRHMSFACSSGDNDANTIESLNSVIGKYLGGYERMSVAAAKLLTIMAHKIKR